jgi:hypothetical protein
MSLTRDNIVPIRQIGSGRSGSLVAKYNDIVARLGLPNVTDLDDPAKVKASWGFMDPRDGRKGFVWCWKVSDPTRCREWSVDGNRSLLKEVFYDINSTRMGVVYGLR